MAASYKLLLALLPKIPLIARVALMHVLQLSEPAKYLDLRSELVICVLRSFLQPTHPRSISSTQKLTLRDPGIKGRIWVSNFTSPLHPEKDIRDALLECIDGLKDPEFSVPNIRLPELVPVEAEWTGYRAAAMPDSTLPLISEQEKFVELEKECNSPATILYFHGGAYYLCDPSTHRPATKKLAKLTGGKCFCVRYRLAPQHPFPAALLDALVAYLTLLHPPPGSYHAPVRPEHIVFSGDRLAFPNRISL
jgi:acetyl esterase/lipase